MNCDINEKIVSIHSSNYDINSADNDNVQKRA